MHRYENPHRRPRWANRLLPLALLASLAVAAQEQTAAQSTSTEPDEPALWEFRFAAFGRYAPVYPAAEESDLTVLPIPIPVYRGSFLRFGESLDQVARGEIAETPRLRLGIDVDFTFGEDSEEIPVRRGMPDLDFLLQIGPELEIRLNNRAPEEGQIFLSLQLRGAVSFDGLEPSSRGFVLNPELEYRRAGAFGGDNLLSVRWRPTWASEDYMDYYYEVEPVFATPSRPVYDATSGYLGSRFTAAVTRQIHERLVLGISASYQLNHGARNDTSPLYQSDTGASLQLAFVWTLAESERRAKRKSDDDTDEGVAR